MDKRVGTSRNSPLNENKNSQMKNLSIVNHIGWRNRDNIKEQTWISEKALYDQRKIDRENKDCYKLMTHYQSNDVFNISFSYEIYVCYCQSLGIMIKTINTVSIFPKQKSFRLFVEVNETNCVFYWSFETNTNYN